MEILRAADTDGNGTINYTGKWLEFYLFRIFGGNYGLTNFP